MTNAHQVIKNFIRRQLYKYLGLFAYGRYSYAQEGEDLIVDRLLSGKRKGFYVEVGCHHPFRFSNSYLLYRRGWSGICIDPLPGTRLLFNKHRPRDLVIEMGVGEENSTLTYFMFNEPALNSFDRALSLSRDGRCGARLIKTIDVEVRRLSEIMSDHKGWPPIDVLSVDVEGFDIQVLRSNDWIRCRPAIIIAECLGLDLRSLASDPVVAFLSELDYSIYAKTGNSVVFVDKKEVSRHGGTEP